jgi:hypothetical protein
VDFPVAGFPAGPAADFPAGLRSPGADALARAGPTERLAAADFAAGLPAGRLAPPRSGIEVRGQPVPAALPPET